MYYILNIIVVGGSYKKIRGKIKKYDEYNRVLILDNNTVIHFDYIYDVSIEN